MNKVEIKEVKRIGVIGGGQLAWMMASAAQKLELELIVQTPHASDPAVAIANSAILAPIDDAKATSELATRCDTITFENEFVDLPALQPLVAQGVHFQPNLSALAPLLDKYSQRCYLRDLGLPVPNFVTLEEFQTENSRLKNQNSLVIKARRHGYDGQGTFIVKNKEALTEVLAKLENTPLLIEEFIPFAKELAVIAARSVTGEIVIYPVVETQQEAQVCHRVIVPAEIGQSVQAKIEAIAGAILQDLKAVGVFGIELFLTASGKVLVNEIAPRNHNSGHFTIDACETSQFEMHLRAISGLRLGSPRLKSAGAVMVNLLGYEHSASDYLTKRQQLEKLPKTHVLWYNKTESRPGRKLGHVTTLLETHQLGTAKAIAQNIESIWYGE